MSAYDLDVERIAREIGRPVGTWAGDCDTISHLLARSGYLERAFGLSLPVRVVRGHWIGPISEDSHFGYAGRAGLPFVQHTWIEAVGLVVPAEEERNIPLDAAPRETMRIIRNPIIDPTRFAFDGRPPYVYVGESDHYDAGGNAWRTLMEAPIPPYDPSHNRVHLDLPAEVRTWIAAQMRHQKTGRAYPYDVYTFPLVMWLANLSLPRLGGYAEPLFRALVDAGHGATIPIDNRRIVLGR